MEHLETEHEDRELAAVFSQRRPVPDAVWVRSLEHRILPMRRQRWTWGLPQVRMGAAAAFGLALLLVTLSLAGIGPLGGGSDAVRAREDCKSVPVTRTQPVPAVVVGPDGEPRVISQRQPQQRFERRCR